MTLAGLLWRGGVGIVVLDKTPRLDVGQRDAERANLIHLRIERFFEVYVADFQARNRHLNGLDCGIAARVGDGLDADFGGFYDAFARGNKHRIRRKLMPQIWQEHTVFVDADFEVVGIENLVAVAVRERIECEILKQNVDFVDVEGGLFGGRLVDEHRGVAHSHIIDSNSP